MRFLLALLFLFATAAQGAACYPAQMLGSGGVAVYSENAKGCWIGWRCKGVEAPYIAAAVKSKCGLVGTRKFIGAWIASPSLSALQFGSDPHTDPELKEVWYSERAKIPAAP